MPNNISNFSLHGIPRTKIAQGMNLIKGGLITTRDLIPKTYPPFLDQSRYTLEEIYAFFEPTPVSLAHKYIAHAALTDFERDRIIHEGGSATFHTLLQGVGPVNPLTIQIADFLGITLKIDKILL